MRKIGSGVFQLTERIKRFFQHKAGEFKVFKINIAHIVPICYKIPVTAKTCVIISL